LALDVGCRLAPPEERVGGSHAAGEIAPSPAVPGLPALPAELGLELGPELPAQPGDLVDDPVAGLADGPGEGPEELLDLGGDAADAQDGGEGADEHGDRLGQGTLDEAGHAAPAAGGDRHHGIEHRVDELHVLGAPGDD